MRSATDMSSKLPCMLIVLLPEVLPCLPDFVDRVIGSPAVSEILLRHDHRQDQFVIVYPEWPANQAFTGFVIKGYFICHPHSELLCHLDGRLLDEGYYGRLTIQIHAIARSRGDC